MRSGHPPQTASVILFRPRRAGFRTPPKAPRPQGAGGSGRPLLPWEDADDPRHRRRIHALGLAFCLVLAVVGVWVANEFTEMKRVQDCVLSGRAGCIPLKVAAHSDLALP
jgi:hypothetical protein